MKKMLYYVMALTLIFLLNGCVSSPTVNESKVKQEILSGNDVKPFSFSLGSLISTGDNITYSDSTVTITGK